MSNIEIEPVTELGILAKTAYEYWTVHIDRIPVRPVEWRNLTNRQRSEWMTLCQKVRDGVNRDTMLQAGHDG